MRERQPLEDLLQLSDGELALALRRAENVDPWIAAVASVGLREGWSEVRTLRMTVLVLSEAREDLVAHAVRMSAANPAPFVVKVEHGGGA